MPISSNTEPPRYSAIEADKPVLPTTKLPNQRVKRRIKTTFYRTPRRAMTAEETELPHGWWDRLLQAFMVTLIYAAIGFLVDGIIYVVKAMVSVAPVQIFWLFLPLLVGIGLILGWLIGGRALDALLIPFQTRNNPNFDEASFGYGIMKALGLGLILAVLGWLILMMVT